MTVWAQTSQGARDLDRAATAEAVARAGREQALTREAEALAQIRVAEAKAEAAQRAHDRAAERRARVAEAAQARRDADAARRAERRTARAAAWSQRRPLLAVVPMMATSAAVAIPAQFEYYKAATHSSWSAATIAGMVEGGTWLGAALESAAVRRRDPAGFYRVLTWGLAGIAAGVNLAHGLTMRDDAGVLVGGWQVGVAFALASLMGVISWSAYMRLRTHQGSATTPEQLRLAMWRRLRYPRLSWRAMSLRAAIGATVSVEDAWRQVWDQHHAAPLHRSGDPEPVASAPPVDLDPGLDLDRVERVEVDPARVEGVDLVDLVHALPVEQGDSVAATVPAEQAIPARPSPYAAAVVPVWIEAPTLDPLDPVEVDPTGAEEVERLLARLDAAIAAKDLAEDSSAETVRKTLGIAWRTARMLLDERARRAKDTTATTLDPAPVDLDPASVDLDPSGSLVSA